MFSVVNNGCVNGAPALGTNLEGRWNGVQGAHAMAVAACVQRGKTHISAFPASALSTPVSQLSLLSGAQPATQLPRLPKFLIMPLWACLHVTLCRCSSVLGDIVLAVINHDPTAMLL